MDKNQIIEAYCHIRTIDNTIPDQVLDYMKDASIGYEKLQSEKHELLENAQMHVDALDLSDIEFYNKYGFNSAELMDRTRELIKRTTE